MKLAARARLSAYRMGCTALLVLPYSVVAAQEAGPGTALPAADVAARSRRTASYRIEAVLDPELQRVQGRQTMTWINASSAPASDFLFHLYLNAFKNDRSTYFRERGVSSAESLRGNWGWCRVDRVTRVDAGGSPLEDLTPTLTYVQPDDDNADDRTVFRLRTTLPVGPGDTLYLEFEFTSQLPRAIDRTGFLGDFFFVAQWFPKIGVLQDGEWNCHQVHRHSEYFADFGVYDVRLTVPEAFQVAATGRELSRQRSDGGTTYRFYQEDVHDFAWAASPRFRRQTSRFVYPGMQPVEVVLFLQPEHVSQAERHFRAVFNALRHFGTWYGPYPYETLTVVDPAYGSQVGGMEYPTLITAGTHWWAPAAVQSPEAVIVHEVAHQYWYGMVANNEFEEPWLDEGFSTYSAGRLMGQVYGPDPFLRRFFGGVPFVSREVRFGPFDADRDRVRREGGADAIARRSWEYLGEYGVNAYSKPALVLRTLENLLGEELMARVMRTYFERWRFRHPTTTDFVTVVSEVTAQDWVPFFEETFFRSGVLDYAVVRVASQAEFPRSGEFDHGAAEVAGQPEEVAGFHSEVVVRRLGDIRLPVDLEVRFADGSVRSERWDGRYPWQRFVYRSSAPVREAVLDPQSKLALDVNPVNNSLRARPHAAWGARKWGARWLFWFQHLLESFAFFS